MSEQTTEGLIARALQAHANGRLDEASRFADQAISVEPHRVDALVLAGVVAVKQNRSGEALHRLEMAKELAPGSFEANYWLSMALRNLGRLQEAVDYARCAVDLAPTSDHAQNHMGMCLLDIGAAPDAVLAFQHACELSPRAGPYFDHLGRALQAAGNTADAILAYRRAVEIGPPRPGILYRLGDAYMAEPNVGAAADCARAILRGNPNSAPGNLLLARAFIGSGQVEEGAKYAQAAMQISPENAVPVAYYGWALQSLGRIEEADEQFKRSIELEPNQGFAYYALVHNHKVTDSERPLLEKMRQLSSDSQLPPRETIQLEYGLGKSLEDLGEYEAAMSHYNRANELEPALKVGVAPFQKSDLEHTADFLLDTFNPRFFEVNLSAGNDSDVPIYVVGMMRSGTTLAEQILSSHPQIGGAGEQSFWPDHAGSSQKLFKAGSANPELDLVTLRILASEYLAVLANAAPGMRKVVDKMNTNYLLLGLLHTAFPSARIIHMRRHPVDTCLSIWATPAANRINLGASKDNIVFAYEQYLRVMAHWREVLPADRLLEVDYETLVSDQEATTRKMIEFCEMEWSDDCLRPEKNDRSVQTPSVWQVRQPVYKTSVARWKRFENCLGEFSNLLD